MFNNFQIKYIIGKWSRWASEVKKIGLLAFRNIDMFVWMSGFHCPLSQTHFNMFVDKWMSTNLVMCLKKSPQLQNLSNLYLSNFTIFLLVIQDIRPLYWSVLCTWTTCNSVKKVLRYQWLKFWSGGIPSVITWFQPNLENVCRGVSGSTCDQDQAKRWQLVVIVVGWLWPWGGWGLREAGTHYLSNDKMSNSWTMEEVH